MSKPKDQELPLLVSPRETVAAELSERIAIGEEIVGRHIASPTDLKNAKDDYYTWNDYNAELLRRRFTSSYFSEEYSRGPGIWVAPNSSQEDYENLIRDVRSRIRKLESVRERLPLIEEGASVDNVDGDRPLGTSVFVVHGHDEGTREGVARFLEKVGLHAVILHEEANRGMTLIEKFEAHAQAAGYAVVLLTPDDIGRSAGATDAGLTGRARQNVVFEAGFFYGALGRDRVAILYSKGIEKPSDIDGIAWIPLDRQTWKLELGRELRAAGFSVDMNRI